MTRYQVSLDYETGGTPMVFADNFPTNPPHVGTCMSYIDNRKKLVWNGEATDKEDALTKAEQARLRYRK